MKRILPFFIAILVLCTGILLVSCSLQNDSGIIVDGNALADPLTSIPDFHLSSEVDTCKVSYVEKAEHNIEVSVQTDDRHVFDGWYIVNEDSTLLISQSPLELIDLKRDAYRDYVVNGSLHIVACFDAALYVNYQLQGGSFEQAPQVSFDTRESEAVLPQNAVKDGYVFLGWKDFNGNDVASMPQGKTGEVSVQAQWGPDYRDKLIGRVWSAEFTASSENLPLPPCHSKNVIEFLDDEHVAVYSEVNGTYIDLGYCYLSMLHTHSHFPETRNDPVNGMQYQYNDWDFGTLRKDEISNLRYKLVGNQILIYLTSEDDVYARYIEDYLNWNLFALEYDVNKDVLEYKLPYGTVSEENALMGQYIANWETLMILPFGLLPQPLPDIQPVFCSPEGVICQEITDTWESIYQPCNMDIQDFKNSFLRDNDNNALMLVTDYNQIMAGWCTFVDTDLETKYSMTSLLAIRNGLTAISYFVINTGGGNYSVCMFVPMGGTVMCYSGESSSNYISWELERLPDGQVKLYITVEIEDTEDIEGIEDIPEAAVFEIAVPVDSPIAKSYYWAFGDRVQDYEYPDLSGFL